MWQSPNRPLVRGLFGLIFFSNTTDVDSNSSLSLSKERYIVSCVEEEVTTYLYYFGLTALPDVLPFFLSTCLNTISFSDYGRYQVILSDDQSRAVVTAWQPISAGLDNLVAIDFSFVIDLATSATISSPGGLVSHDTVISSPDGKVSLTFFEGTQITKDGSPVDLLDISIDMVEVTSDPDRVGLFDYRFFPSGVEFDPPIQFSQVINTDMLSVDPTDVFLEWISNDVSVFLPGYLIGNTVFTNISHFSTASLIIVGNVPPIPSIVFDLPDLFSFIERVDDSCTSDISVNDLKGTWGIETWARRFAQNEQEKSMSRTHLTVNEVLNLGINHGLGYILINLITPEETKELASNGILTFLARYPGQPPENPSYLPAPFSEQDAYMWANQQFIDNPYLAGIVIDFETDDIGCWGRYMFRGLYRATQEHGKLLGIQPHFNALEINPCMRVSDYVDYSDFLMIWYYGGSPYGDAMVSMYNGWKNQISSYDPSYPVFMEIASGEPNNGARPQGPSDVAHAIQKLSGVTDSLLLFLGDLPLWHLKQGDTPEKNQGYRQNYNLLGDLWSRDERCFFSGDFSRRDPDDVGNIITTNSSLGYFDGAGYIEILSYSDFEFRNGETISIHARVNFLEHISDVGGGSTIISKGINFGLRSSYGSRLSEHLDFWYRGVDDQWHVWQSRNPVLNVNTFHTITFSHTFGSPDSTRAFVDGIEVPGHWVSGRGGNAFNYVSLSGISGVVSPYVSSGSTYIGVAQIDSRHMVWNFHNILQHFHGGMDKVVVLRRPLSVDEFTSFNYSLDDPALVGSWNFETVTQTHVLDSSAKENHGRIFSARLINMTEWDEISQGFSSTNIPSPGDIFPITSTRVANFPGGVNDFIEIPHSASLSPNQGITLSAWIRPTSWRSHSGREKYGLSIFYKGLLGSRTAYTLKLERNGWPIYGTTREGSWHSHSVVPLHTWSHLIVTAHSNGQVVFYLNGNQVGSYRQSSPLLQTSDPLYIGGFWQRGWGWNNNNFIGQIDDVAIWNRALSASEVQKVYARNIISSGLVGYWNFKEGSVLDLSGNNNHGLLKGSVSIISR